jgi:long-subunit fatty acid transport protein
MFLRPVFGEYFRDPFQNIQGQYTIGTGLGYQLIDTSKTEWTVSGGLAYQETQFDSVEAGEDQEVSTPALVMGTNYETDLTKRIDFQGSYSLKLLNEESGKYTHHAVATFGTDLTKWLDFDISLVWDRIQKPTANADGTLPKQDDYKLMFSLGVEY